MDQKHKIVIQGYPGSFHDEAAQRYFEDEIELIPADSFEQLARTLSSFKADYGLMAIENSIAGTILQNYRILRENHFWISGEVYIRIKHNLLGIPGSHIEEVEEVESHPMAINQCLDYLATYPDIKRMESKDTALSALRVAEKGNKSSACIASMIAAEMYGLDILAEGIETNKMNYTRFFVISRTKELYDSRKANKVSAYIRIPDRKGQLLKVLQKIEDHNLNLSKLQSFPVLGAFREYFFHMDIEFDHLDQYFNLKDDILEVTKEYEELGIYARADVSDVIFNLKKEVEL
jgi:prephenate dehydratase